MRKMSVYKEKPCKTCHHFGKSAVTLCSEEIFQNNLFTGKHSTSATKESYFYAVYSTRALLARANRTEISQNQTQKRTSC